MTTNGAVLESIIKDVVGDRWSVTFFDMPNGRSQVMVHCSFFSRMDIGHSSSSEIADTVSEISHQLHQLLIEAAARIRVP